MKCCPKACSTCPASGSPSEMTSEIRPPSCYSQNSATNLWFNGDSTSTVACSTTYSCICWEGSACTNTDATATNAGTCGCGNVVCTTTTGLFCDASKNECGATVPKFKITAGIGCDVIDRNCFQSKNYPEKCITSAYKDHFRSRQNFIRFSSELM